jgi:hypothetical protein
MNGIMALYSPGRYHTPFAGGEVVAFTSNQVTQIGRISTYGDNVVRYLVRIENSDAVYFVKPSVCEKSERKFLEQARDLMKTFPNKDNPLVIVWMDVNNQPTATN